MCIRLFLLLFVAVPLAVADSPKVSTLEQVIARVQGSNPTLQSSKHRALAIEALVRQASLLPNPEIVVEAENFGGDLDGFGESEITVALSQRIELGNKRSARTEVANVEKKIATLEAEILARDILSRTTIAYAKVQAVQARKEILREQKKLSQLLVNAIQKKLEAGAILRVEKTKAEITLSNDQIAFNNSEQELEIAKQRLASLWNGTSQDVGDVDSLHENKAMRFYVIPEDLSSSIRFKLIDLKQDLANSKLQLEESLSVPDVNLGLGYRRFEETEENAFLGTFSVGLPIFNRNQGAIESANHNLEATKFSIQDEKVSLSTSFSLLQVELRRLEREYESIENLVLPASKRAFSQAREAYQRGRTSYLNLLDAQRTLVETKTRRVDLIVGVIESKARIENIIGFPLTREVVK